MPATVATYTTLPGTLGGPLSQRRSGQSRFFLPDHQGNTRQLTDSDASPTDTLLTDAWGVEVTSSGTTATPFKAFGQWGYYRDTSLRSYVRARYLHPILARWSNRDPLGMIDSSAAYIYARNAPANLVDPSGEFSVKKDVCKVKKAIWTCIDGSDRVSIASGLSNSPNKIDLCKTFELCTATKPCAGETCIAINGGFYDLGSGYPAGPVSDCLGNKTNIPNPNPGRFIELPFGSQVTSGKPLFDKNGSCNKKEIPRPTERIARTAACRAPQVCFLTVPDPPGMTADELCACMKSQCKGASNSVLLDGSGSTQWAQKKYGGKCEVVIGGDGRNNNNYIVICGK